MDYCGPRGIPHSQFLGGPPVWTQDDRDKALAWAELDRQTCRGCGTRPAEWEPSKGGDRHAYEFLPDICPGCEQRERTEVVMRGPEWADQRGKTIKVRRRPSEPPQPSAPTRREGLP